MKALTTASIIAMMLVILAEAYGLVVMNQKVNGLTAEIESDQEVIQMHEDLSKICTSTTQRCLDQLTACTTH